MSFYSQLPLEELSAIIARNPDEVELRLALIERYVIDGDLDDALVQACLALNIAPGNPEVLAWKALCLIFEGQIESGHRLLQSVTRRTPCVDFQQKLVTKMIPLFVTSEELDNETVTQPWCLLGSNEHAEVKGPYGDLISSIQQVGQQMDESPDEGLTELARHIEDFPEDLNSKLYLASIHVMQQEFADAEVLYRDVIRQDPECSTAYFDLAIVVTDTSEAIELLRQGLKLFPHQDVALYNLGTFLLNEGELDQARTELSRVPADSTLYSDSLLAIGVSHESEGNNELASEYFEKVTILAPERPEVQAKYGQLLMDAGKKTEALSAFKIALELAPETFCAWHNKGVIHLDFNQDEQAMEAFEHALRIRPDSAWTAINLSSLLRDRNETDRAIQILLNAHQQNPSDVIILQNLGAYFSFTNQLDLATQYTQMAIELDPSRSILYWNMADAYAKQSDREHCLEFLAQAIEMDASLAERFTLDSDFESFWQDPSFQLLVEKAQS